MVSPGQNPVSGGRQPALVVRRPQGELCVLEVRCALDMESAPSFGQVVFQELDDGCRGLVIDLSGCDFLGSSGLTVLVASKQRAEGTGTRVALAGPSRIAVRALQVSGLDSLFDSYPSVSDAVAALS